MSLSFLRHRSQVTREDSTRALEASVQQIGKLVLNLTALAERVETRPARDLDEARTRQEKVQVLRDAAEAGQAAIRRITESLVGGSGRGTSSGHGC